MKHFARVKSIRRLFLALIGLVAILIVLRITSSHVYPTWPNEWIVWPAYIGRHYPIDPYNDPFDPLNNYVRLHESILKTQRSQQQQSSPPSSRVVFNGEIRPGYANRMYGVLTSMVAAVITDSALIVRWKKIEEYMEPPLPGSFDLFDNNSFLNQNYE